LAAPDEASALRGRRAGRQAGKAAPMKTVIRFLRDEKGATSIEYALIATGIAVAIITAVNGVGSALDVRYKSIEAAVK
jgi:pilus assembly protein Flp/PilA